MINCNETYSLLKSFEIKKKDGFINPIYFMNEIIFCLEILACIMREFGYLGIWKLCRLCFARGVIEQTYWSIFLKYNNSCCFL